MPKYVVKSPLEHDGRRYEPGATVELTAEAAAAMPWAVEAAPPPGPKKKNDAEA